MRGVVNGIFGSGTQRVRGGDGGVEGLIGIYGGRLTMRENDILIGISGTIYTGIMHMIRVLAKRG
jgi:hypothetical protein